MPLLRTLLLTLAWGSLLGGGPALGADKIGKLNCTGEGEIAKFLGGQWVCAVDSDTDTNAETLCASDQLLDGDGNCVAIPVDTDTLAGLDCSTEQIARYDGTQWVCSDDNLVLIAALEARVFALETGCQPGDRYADQGDGTVIDCNTGLYWLKDATCDELGPDGDWQQAQSAVALLADGACGLSDGSAAGDWRLPTPDEFCSVWDGTVVFCPASAAPDSLIDASVGPPTLSNAAGDGVWTENDPFTDVRSGAFEIYWSSASNADDPGAAWSADLRIGLVLSSSKTDIGYFWPVRDGP